MKIKSIIFGASKSGSVAYELLQEKYEIVGFSDNNSKKWGTLFCEKVVYSPNELMEMKDVEIIIASVYYASIYEQLRNIGLEKLSVFYFLGDASVRNDKKEYILYQLPEQRLFENCVYDEKMVQLLEKDFSNNYHEVIETENRISWNKTYSGKKVLFCAYIFPPLGGSGVQRSLKFVKYLREFGYEPIILTVGKDDKKIVRDNSLLDEIPDDLTIIRIDMPDVFLPELLSQTEQQEILNLYSGVVKSPEWIEEYLEIVGSKDSRLIPDNRIVWVNECLKHIEQKLDLSQIDLVFTTGYPYSTFFVGYYLKKKYGIKWVQDYRDPWTSNEFYLENYYQGQRISMHLQKELEKQFVTFSDAIAVIAESTIREYKEEFNIDTSKILEITNGYDEDDFQNIRIVHEKNQKFTLCHNGCLYGDRNPETVIMAVNDLIAEKRIKEDGIRIIFNGTVDDNWKQLLDKKDSYKLIQYNGYLSHMESIISASNSDLLLLFGLKGAGSQLGYSGKLFEYLRMKKPILSYSEKGGILDRVLDKAKAGKNFDYNDLESTKWYIEEMYIRWKENKKIIVNDTVIEKYSRRSTTKRLADVFTAVLGDEN